MEDPSPFTLNHDYVVRIVDIDDAERLQPLYDRCSDFALLVDGEPFSATMAKEGSRAIPEGKSLKDKILFGISRQSGEMVGLLDVVRDYPDEGTWWIGLLLLVPEVRGKGIGGKIVQGFADYIKTQRGKAIMLGVVELNQPAFEFWQRMGFGLVSKTEPRPFGKKMQAVYVMRR